MPDYHGRILKNAKTSCARQTSYDADTDKQYTDFISDRVRPLFNESFDWPTIQTFREMQHLHLLKKDKQHYDQQSFLWTTHDKKVIIPEQALKLQTRLVVVAHNITIHAGNQQVINLLQSKIYWSTIRKQVKRLRQVCVHCNGTMPMNTRRILLATPSATSRNELIHADYYYLNSKYYILVLKDDFSTKIELFLIQHATALEMANAILWWRARYGLQLNTTIKTDRGSHFVNQFLENLQQVLHFQQKFTVAYSPWSNGKIEIVNNSLTKFIRLLKSEFRLSA